MKHINGVGGIYQTWVTDQHQEKPYVFSTEFGKKVLHGANLPSNDPPYPTSPLRPSSERLPCVSQVRRSFDSHLISKVVHIPLELFFLVHYDYVFAPQPVAYCPREIGITKPGPLRRFHSRDSKEAEACVWADALLIQPAHIRAPDAFFG